jgi:hypothetical protein
MKAYIILLILLYLILIVQCYNKQNTEYFGNYYSSCGYVPELLKKVMDEKNIKKNDKDYDFYIPCSYNDCEKDILGFENKNGKKLFLIDGCDWLASKLGLWELLKEHYGNDATLYMPTTHLLENEEDLNNFPTHFNKNKKNRPDQMYVLKNYEQRQEGIKLTRNLNEIINGLANGWYLVQDYVYDPYLINGRKINFRYYLLVICRNGNIEGYIHKDGFVYYTPKYYNEYDIDFDKHITTGYIDRKVYDTNPLTLIDFRNHLNKKQDGLSDKWDTNAEKLMNKVMEAISKKICKNNKLKNNVRFQLFGCDLAPDSNLNVKLMEINKGPDLSAKDERDKIVKFNVQKDIFKLLDPDEENNELNNIIKTTDFIKIY